MPRYGSYGLLLLLLLHGIRCDEALASTPEDSENASSPEASQSNTPSAPAAEETAAVAADSANSTNETDVVAEAEPESTTDVAAQAEAEAEPAEPEEYHPRLETFYYKRISLGPDDVGVESELEDVLAHHRSAAILVLFWFAICIGIATSLGLFRQKLLTFCQKYRRLALHRAKLLSAPEPNEQISGNFISFIEFVIVITMEFCLEPCTALNVLLGTVGFFGLNATGIPPCFKWVNFWASGGAFCFVFARELREYLNCTMLDEAINNTSVEYRDRAMYRRKAAKALRPGDSIIVSRRGLDGAHVPASISVSACKPPIIFLNTRNETGEDCSVIAKQRMNVPAGAVLGSPESVVMGEVSTTWRKDNDVKSWDAANAKVRTYLPDCTNSAVLFLNSIAFVLLCIVGYVVAVVGTQKLLMEKGVQVPSSLQPFGLFYSAQASKFEAGTLETIDQELWSNMWATMLIFSCFLPLTRFPLAFFFFVESCTWMFPKSSGGEGVEVRNYAALSYVSKLRLLFADSTGTLTPPAKAIHSMVQCAPGLSKVASKLGVAEETLIAGVLLACNNTRMHHGIIDGTSPEEMEIVRFLLNGPRSKVLDFSLLTNPLEAGPKASEALSFTANGETPKIDVVSRSKPSKEDEFHCAELKWSGKKVVIRQGTPSILAKRAKYVAEEADLAKQIGNRQAWGFTLTLEGEPEFFALHLTFENLMPAPSIALREGLRAQGIALRLMTGDNEIAAIHTAELLGLGAHGRMERLPQGSHEEMEAALQKATSASCVAVHCEVLCKVLSIAAWCEKATPWLIDGKVDMVIYGVTAQGKATIVKKIASLFEGKSDDTVAMLGDGIDDIQVLQEPSVVGLVMTHGAPACISAADIVVSTPDSILGLMQKYKPTLMNGLDILVGDVCFNAGILTGLGLVGVWSKRIALSRMPAGLIFEDQVFAPGPLQLLSCVFHPLSFVLCVLGKQSESTVTLTPQSKFLPAILLMIGLLAGALLGSLGPGSDWVHYYGGWATCCAYGACILHHSLWLPVTGHSKLALCARCGHLVCIVALGIGYQDALRSVLF